MGADQSTEQGINSNNTELLLGVDTDTVLQDAKASMLKGHYLHARKQYLLVLDAQNARYQKQKAEVSLPSLSQSLLPIARTEAKLGDLFVRQRMFDNALEHLNKSQEAYDECRRLVETEQRTTRGGVSPQHQRNHNKNDDQLTLDEYKTLLNNIAFAQYNLAQQQQQQNRSHHHHNNGAATTATTEVDARRKKKELQDAALEKWNIVSQMNGGAATKSSHHSNNNQQAAEALTFMSCIHMERNNYTEARRALTKSARLHAQVGASREATVKLYKSLTKRMSSENAAITIQRATRRKLKWLHIRRIFLAQRECVEEEEKAQRETLYLLEDNVAFEWYILFFQSQREVLNSVDFSLSDAGSSQHHHHIERLRIIHVLIRCHAIVIEQLWEEQAEAFSKIETAFADATRPTSDVEMKGRVEQDESEERALIEEMERVESMSLFSQSSSNSSPSFPPSRQESGGPDVGRPHRDDEEEDNAAVVEEQHEASALVLHPSQEAMGNNDDNLRRNASSPNCMSEDAEVCSLIEDLAAFGVTVSFQHDHDNLNNNSVDGPNHQQLNDDNHDDEDSQLLATTQRIASTVHFLYEEGHHRHEEEEEETATTILELQRQLYFRLATLEHLPERIFRRWWKCRQQQQRQLLRLSTTTTEEEGRDEEQKMHHKFGIQEHSPLPADSGAVQLLRRKPLLRTRDVDTTTATTTAQSLPRRPSSIVVQQQQQNTTTIMDPNLVDDTYRGLKEEHDRLIVRKVKLMTSLPRRVSTTSATKLLLKRSQDTVNDNDDDVDDEHHVELTAIKQHISILEQQIAKRRHILEQERQNEKERLLLMKQQRKEEQEAKRAAIKVRLQKQQDAKDRLQREKQERAEHQRRLREEEQRQLALARAQNEASVIQKRHRVHSQRKSTKLRKVHQEDSDDDEITAEELAIMQRHFDTVDTDRSGSIEQDEFVNFFASTSASATTTQQLTKKDLQGLFVALDVDEGGSLSIDEFVHVYRKMIELQQAKGDPVKMAAFEAKLLLRKKKRATAASSMNASSNSKRRLSNRSSRDDNDDEEDDEKEERERRSVFKGILPRRPSVASTTTTLQQQKQQPTSRRSFAQNGAKHDPRDGDDDDNDDDDKQQEVVERRRIVIQKRRRSTVAVTSTASLRQEQQHEQENTATAVVVVTTPPSSPKPLSRPRFDSKEAL